ncbi:MAG: ATP-binding cassette domain-containing protein, partial [bacterium]
VLRNGEKVWEGEIAGLVPEDLIGKMVGSKEGSSLVLPWLPKEEKILEVESLSDGKKLQGISFSLHRGEILGVYGLQGSGRTELLETLFGVRKRASGVVFFRGEPFEPASPEEAIRKGVALVPEDRGKKGLILEHSLFDNVALPHLAAYQGLLGYFRERKLKPALGKVVERLRTRYRSLEEKVQFLSGGNQQKVVLAKWILTEPKILILDTPTHGVDIGAKENIYQSIIELTEKGLSIVLISDEEQEVMMVSDRVLVMKSGRIVGEFDTRSITEEDLRRKVRE